MKSSKQKITILAIATCASWASPAAAAAGGTWRCGNTYTDQPCAEGKAIAIDDTRDAAQKREADQSTRRVQTAGDRLERERLRQEAAQAGRPPTIIDGRLAAPKSAGDSASKKKGGKKDSPYFSAHDPVATAKKKAEKAAKTARRGADKS